MTAGGDRSAAPHPIDDRDKGERPPRSPLAFGLMLCLLVSLFAAFVALGVWQVHRRTWKLALIERVDQRIHAAPSAAPGPGDWPTISRQADEYRHVELTGRYDNGRETLVQANTELGPGFWVLTPFETTRGFIVLINRGFVPPERRDPSSRTNGQIGGTVNISGLLRITEPGGGFLRHNDPAHDKWFSRDVAAIARARGLGVTAPYFVDADKASLPSAAPVGGLTVVSFPNNHLQYAITWFGLALLTAIGMAILIRDRQQVRSRATFSGNKD